MVVSITTDTDRLQSPGFRHSATGSCLLFPTLLRLKCGASDSSGPSKRVTGQSVLEACDSLETDTGSAPKQSL